MNLRSEDLTLVVHSVGRLKVSVATKHILLKICVNTPRGTLKSHQLICYGLDKIAEAHRHFPALSLSLNDILIKGPDVLNPIRVVLLRIQVGVLAALGDSRKIYSSVWLEERDVHLHRFLWRDTEGAEIEDFTITRDNIGDEPAWLQL